MSHFRKDCLYGPAYKRYSGEPSSSGQMWFPRARGGGGELTALWIQSVGLEDEQFWMVVMVVQLCQGT